MTILRIRSNKLGKIRFTSHRDVARIWERGLRQANLPVAYSQGFSPRAKIAYGLALPTGSESSAEYIDVDIDDERPMPCSLDRLCEVLSAVLPPGIDLTGVGVLERGTPSLQQAVTSCVWDITVKETIDQVNDWSQRVLAASSIVVTRERKGKPVTDDLRPNICSLEIVPSPSGTTGTTLRAELRTQPRSLRPAELLEALDPALEALRLRRHQQWIESDGARLEPLQAGAAAAPHTPACAS